MDIRKCEIAMWDAALNKDVNSFKRLVSDDAVMICGGYRCTGKEYAEFVKDFDISEYSIISFENIYISDEIIQVHYVIETKVENRKDADLAGTFHVTSSWVKRDDSFKLIFNMDSRIIER